MNKAQYIIRSSWITDDQRFKFNFEINTNGNVIENKVKVSLKFVSLSSGEKLLWDNIELIVNDNELTIFENRADDFCIKGTLKAFLVKKDKYSNLVIWGDYQNGVPDNLYHFTGVVAIEKIDIPSLTPSAPSMPDEPVLKLDTESISPDMESGTYNDLFPSTWPDIDKQELDLYFVVYQAVITSPPVNLFFDTLVSLKKTNDRNGIEEEAKRFIDNDRLYKGVFISDLQDLTGKIAKFPLILIEFENMVDYSSAVLFVCEFLDTSVDHFYSYLKSQDYIVQKEKLWQSYFALIIKIGYNTRYLDQITRLLIACNLLEEIFFNLTEKINKMPFNHYELSALIRASIILPESIFPLPLYSSPPP